MKGLTFSEALWSCFQGNEAGMQKAITKGDLRVLNGMYYWHMDIHEHITGGKDTMQFGKGEPHAMTQQDKEKMLELLDYAPWAKWSTTPNNVPEVDLKKALKPDSDAMERAQECLDASKAVCINVQTFFKNIQKEGIMTNPKAGSIPSIMNNAMKAAKDMEKEHMQPMAELIYDVDGTKKVTKGHVKEMLNAAAKDLKNIQQYLLEAKALVQKYRREQEQQEWQSLNIGQQ